MKKNKISAISVVFLSSLVFIAGCTNPLQKTEITPTPVVIPEVEIMVTDRTIITPQISLSGTVVAQEEITIASEVSGTVSKVIKKEGQSVGSGEKIMQLGTGDNMLSVSYASAQKSLDNATKLLTLTRQAGQKQIKNAELSVEKAKINYQRLLDTKKLNNTAQKAQTQSTQQSVELAEKSLEIAKKTFADIQANEVKKEKDILESAAQVLPNVFIPTNASLNFVDNLLGFSPLQKTNNDAYESYLYGDSPDDLIIISKEDWRKMDLRRQEFKIKYTQLLSENKTIENVSAELAFALDILRSTRNTLRNTEEILQHSFATPSFPQTQINGYQSQVQTYIQSIEGAISSVIAQQQTISNFLLQSPQRIIDAQLQVSVAENKVLSAKEGLVVAQSSEGVQDTSQESAILDAKNAIDIAMANVEMAKVQAGVNEQNIMAQLTSAQASVDSAAFSLSKLSIQAGIGGTITKILKKDGDTIQAGTPLVVISNVSALKLVSDVSLEESLQIKVGTPAKINISGVPQEFTGSIQFIAPEADKTTRRVKVEILIPNSVKIPANAFATATLTLPALPAKIYIPFSSVVAQNPPTIFLVETNKQGKKVLVKKEVEIGEQKDANIEIIRGLRPNQWVVTALYPTLFEGDEVVIKSKEPIIQSSSPAPSAVNSPSSIQHSSSESARTPAPVASPIESEDPLKKMLDRPAV